MVTAVADPGWGPKGPCPLPRPGPVKMSHKKMAYKGGPHKCHVSRPPTRPLDPLLHRFQYNPPSI